MSDSADVKPSQMERITIQVMFNNRPIKFKLKKTSSLKKVLNAAAKELHMERDALRFTYNGVTLRGAEDDTPDSLGMEDNDQIDAHVQQIGGKSSLLRH